MPFGGGSKDADAAITSDEWRVLMSVDCSPTAHDLTRRSTGLRKLAARVTRDVAQAEDLVQETLLSALTRRPKVSGTELDRWLGRVLINGARTSWRRRVRRRAREASCARDEGSPSTLDVVARAEMERRLRKAVLALDEPYQSAVMLRYFAALRPGDIARRRGVNPSTVRSHLRRALRRLRRALAA